MASRTKLTDAATLELYRVALENAETQTEIASVMAELGFDNEVLLQGKALLTQARQAYDLNKTEDDETSAAYADFSSKKEQLESTYNMHRKKAKVVFRNDSLTADKLAISGSMPRTYINWLEAAKKFYSVASTDTDIQSKLARLAKIDDWMSEFYAVARIGLEDNPQLLEALGKVVK